MEHNSDFTHDLKFGQKGESVVAEILQISEDDKIEVKSERNIWKDTGNVFVEFYCRGKPSGIATTEAKWWMINFCDDDEVRSTIIISTKKLKTMVSIPQKYRIVNGGDNNTSKGFLVPIIDLIQ